MKLISNRLCRARFKIQRKVRRWARGKRWGWDTGKPKAEKEENKNK